MIQGKFKHLATHIVMLIFACLGFINISHAGTITASSKASATLAANCTISVSNFSLGNITASSTSDTTNYVSASGNITATCSKGISYQIFMNNGSYGTTGRNMKGTSKGDLIPYMICRVNSVIGSQCSDDYWGLDSAHSLQSIGTGSVQTLPAYIFYKKGFYTPDNYSDTMTATLSF
jgi:spore coat protein U-like protein